MKWICPPACQGQIVVVEYASGLDGMLYRRITDRSDGSVEYACAEAGDCGCEDECSCFEPWNFEPTAFEWESCENPENRD
jgi:hypothetical protein